MMGGIGVGEIILMVSVVAVAAVFLSLVGVLKPVRGKHGTTEFERRVLDELATVHLRLDMIAKRLDDAGIPSPPQGPALPRDSG